MLLYKLPSTPLPRGTNGLVVRASHILPCIYLHIGGLRNPSVCQQIKFKLRLWHVWIVKPSNVLKDFLILLPFKACVTKNDLVPKLLHVWMGEYTDYIPRGSCRFCFIFFPLPPDKSQGTKLPSQIFSAACLCSLLPHPQSNWNLHSDSPKVAAKRLHFMGTDQCLGHFSWSLKSQWIAPGAVPVVVFFCLSTLFPG